MYANNLRFCRLESGLTQAKLATIVGISVQHIQRLEYGDNKPRHDTAQKIATALGIPAETLFPVEGSGKGQKHDNIKARTNQNHGMGRESTPEPQGF